jgi:tetratricopeptide (TPR) repeat protein
VATRNDFGYRRIYGSEFGRLAGALAASGQEEPALQLLEESREAFSYLPDFPHSSAIADYARTLNAFATIEPDAGDEALRLYGTALRLDPVNQRLAEEASNAALALEENDLAVEILERFDRTEEYPPLLGNLALAYARLGRVEEARTAFQAALEVDPLQPAALTARDLLAEP